MIPNDFPSGRNKDYELLRKENIFAGKSEERECLLMGEYSPEYVKSLDRAESNLDLESDGNDDTPKSSEPEDADSSTDIDAIVEEYKEKLKVSIPTPAVRSFILIYSRVEC